MSFTFQFLCIHTRYIVLVGGGVYLCTLDNSDALTTNILNQLQQLKRMYQQSSHNCTHSYNTAVPHLQEPWFQLAVKQDIKAEDLKAGTPTGVVWEAGSVVVAQNGMCCYERLNDDILWHEGGGGGQEEGV